MPGLFRRPPHPQPPRRFVRGGVAALTVTLGLLDGGAAIYSPTIQPQPVTVGALPLLDGGSAIYAPTLTPKSTITLPLIGGASYNDTVQADSPVAYWRLGEASGNPQDSVGTNHVTAVGGTPTYGQTGALSGDADSAITLDGSTEYFTVPDAAPLDLGNGPFSYELWAKRADADASYQILIGKTDGLAGADPIVYFENNKFGMDANSGTHVVEESGSTTDTNWHHFVVTRTGSGAGNFKVYKDGVDVTVEDAGQINGSFTSNNFDLTIGRYAAVGSYFNGSLDEIAVYNVALSPAQVLAHYQAGTGTGGAAIYSPTLTPKSTLTLALLDGAAAIYAPTVLPQAVTVSLALLDGVSALYAPDIRPAQFVGALDLIDGSSAIYAPTLTVGAASAALPLLDGSNAIFALTLTPTNAIALDLIESTSATFAPSLGFTLSLDLLDAGSAIYAPEIQLAQFVGPLDLLDGSSVIYQPTITVGAVTLSLDLLESASAIYDPTVQSIVGGALPLLDGGAAIYDLIVAPQPVTVELDLLDGGPVIYALTASQGAAGVQAVTLDFLDSLSEFYAPTLTTGAVTITLPDLDGGAELYAPLILSTNDIELAMLDGGSALYSPTLTQAGVPVLGLPLLDGSRAIYSLRVRLARRGGKATVPTGPRRDLIEEDDEEILIALLAS